MISPAPVELCVAICTRDRRESLGRVLDSLADQIASVSWEVLVVDNGSDDGSAELVRARVDDYPVSLRLSRESRRGIALARNRALQDAAGGILVFLDDDMTVHAGLVEVHARALRDPGVVATGGRIVPRLPQGAPHWIEEAARTAIGGPTGRYDFGDEVREVGGATRTPAPFAGNMGLNRALALEVGSFRADLGYAARLIPGEESELCRRLVAGSDARRMIYLPDAIAEHHVQLDKTSEDYGRRWYRGHGRVTVLEDPPRSLGDRLLRIVKSSGRALIWRLRGLRSSWPRGNVLRKGCRAEGKLLQLIGL